MTEPAKRRRIEWIDLARGIALVAMATYHFSWDLEFFGYLDPGTAGTGPLKWYARAIASSFLILVGVSLVLAHGRGIRWNGFWKRLGTVAAAALAITVATYFFTPDAYVFFGILHEIALASLLGLAFLRLPAIALAAIAAVWFSVPWWAASDFFSHPALLWLGLSPIPPHSNDFVPVFPWFAAVLAGMAIGRFLVDTKLTTWLADRPPHTDPATRSLRFLGRHSLITYLVHQPVLIACVYLFSLVSPVSHEETFLRSCRHACVAESGKAACEAFCSCAVERFQRDGLFESVFKGEITQQSDERVAVIVQQCTIDAGIYGN